MSDDLFSYNSNEKVQGATSSGGAESSSSPELSRSEINKRSTRSEGANVGEFRSYVSRPLSELLRPSQTTQIIGQKSIDIFKNQKLFQSLILWGPPGCGKTTFALTFKGDDSFVFKQLNATEIGAKILKESCDEATKIYSYTSKKTILFIDEIHRLNKATQDVLLPYVENGTILLIGATTENPGYELNSALLSRCRVVSFKRLGISDLHTLALSAFKYLSLDSDQLLNKEAFDYIYRFSDGDARKLLNSIEFVVEQYNVRYAEYHWPLGLTELTVLLSQNFIRSDKAGDQHYDLTSALIKSVRGSDPDASIYYLARMIKAGQDPKFIARRLIILASEDVGNADPKALGMAIDAFKAVEIIGLPEAAINLAQITVYLASAPKSNRSYLAYLSAKQAIEVSGSIDIPLHLRSSFIKAKDNSSDSRVTAGDAQYVYPHDHQKHYVKQDYLPKELKGEVFYNPSEIGYEKHIKSFLSWLKSPTQQNSDKDQ